MGRSARQAYGNAPLALPKMSCPSVPPSKICPSTLHILECCSTGVCVRMTAAHKKHLVRNYCDQQLRSPVFLERFVAVENDLARPRPPKRWLGGSQGPTNAKDHRPHSAPRYLQIRQPHPATTAARRSRHQAMANRQIGAVAGAAILSFSSVQVLRTSAVMSEQFSISTKMRFASSR